MEPTAIKKYAFVSGRLMRSLPDREEFAVFLPYFNLVAYLPFFLAGKTDMKIGSTILATIYETGKRITLTQRSSLFVRQLCEYLLSPLLQSGHTTVCRSAMIAGANFAKVAITTQCLFDALIYIEESKDYVDYAISAVGWDANLEQRIKNALRPAREELIEKITLLPPDEPLKGEVYVRRGTAKRFLGAGGSNIATAAKLLGFKIFLIEI